MLPCFSSPTDASYTRAPRGEDVGLRYVRCALKEADERPRARLFIPSGGRSTRLKLQALHDVGVERASHIERAFALSHDEDKMAVGIPLDAIDMLQVDDH